MIQVKTLDEQIIELYAKNKVDYKGWVEYQDVAIRELDKVDHKLYILSNFADVTGFDPKIALEVGTARHLTHPNLGLIVLLGGSVLMNFILQITENRAQHEAMGGRLRVHKEYERALQVLIQQRDIENQRLMHLR